MKLINALLVAGALAATPVLAQDDEVLKPVVDEAAKINESAAKSQEKINGITDQIDSKLQQFKTLMKEIEGLEVYNTQLRKQINNQEQEMADLNAAIDEVSVVERQITPLMMRMIDGLEQFVALDVPFLPEERANRVADLRAMMDRADVAASEKFRRVMEAYQVEMDYGRTMEARQWEELDSSYRTQITKGLRMAKKQLAPDLLMLPVAITD
ncbi:DUF3450 domain-containing protein [Alteromonas sp. MCA-1]|uniref:DUF3450 domain-containing protein n=1 Tax=Alteromonas sp. MCA-1 TaxID=2917731 RepID=UPI001EF80E54|nr:DUF3450 domain-containing protein [Alteromonas sp. MCA-1]MCG7814962.1 DUF3450 domain-containing protein [Alteromonas sp. MCA-1]